MPASVAWIMERATVLDDLRYLDALPPYIVRACVSFMPSPSDTQEPLNERHDLETDSSLRSMSTGAEFAKDSPVTKPFHATFGHHAPPAARDFANDNESIPSGDIEQTSHRSASPTIFNSRVHDGRSTPAPSQFHNGHYQHSATETSSYFTRTDVEGGLPVGSARGYVAVDPFVPSVAQSIANFAYPSDPWFSQPYLRQSTPAPPLSYHLTETHAFEIPTSKFILAFVLDTLPRQIYLHFLLTLPSLYFSRVARIFEEAELSMPYIKKLVMVSGGQWKDQSASAINANLNVAPSINSPHFSHLKASWEHFIDSLTKEWKTLNIVSVLLLSAILTTLQIDGALTDPITRYSALLALVCSMMSLLFGCLYILRFNTMRKAHKAAEWAEEAQKTQTLIWWNVWVLLALPSIWLSWSIIFYLTCIMSFVWRTGTSHDTILEVTPLTALGPRIGVTFVFTLGLVYLALVISEFRRYGDVMDKAWKRRIAEWGEISESAYAPSIHQRASSLASRAASPFVPHRPPRSPSSFRAPLPPEIPGRPTSESSPLEPTSQLPQELHPSQAGLHTPDAPSSPDEPVGPKPFKTSKVMDLRFMNHVPYERPSILDERGITHEDWSRFIFDTSTAWDGQHPRYQQELTHPGEVHVPRLPPQVTTARLIEWWNSHFFHSHDVEAILCEEHTLEDPESPSHAIYILDMPRPSGNTAENSGGLAPRKGLAERFGSVPDGLERIDVYDPVPYAAVLRPTRMGKTLIYAGPHEARVHWRSSRPSLPNSRWQSIANADSDDEVEGRSVIQDFPDNQPSHIHPRSAMRPIATRSSEGSEPSDNEGAVVDDDEISDDYGPNGDEPRTDIIAVADHENIGSSSQL